MIPVNILNTGKTDYESPALLLGEQRPGLFDTIHPHHPRLRSLFRDLRNQDWDELEFPFDSCVQEFKTCAEHEFDALMDVIAYQWETDSVAAQSLVPITSQFVTSNILNRLYARIGENEYLHAPTYSEILKNSFENPDDILKDIHSRQHSFDRLEGVTHIYEEARIAGLEYGLGQRPNNQELYEIAMKYLLTNLAMEGVQFTPSFTLAFAYGKQGRFMPVADAIQKIAVDEYHIHVPTGQYVLDWEFGTERGITAWQRLSKWFIQLVRGIVHTEYSWNARQFRGGREHMGLTNELLDMYVRYCATKILKSLKIPVPEDLLQERNPLPWTEQWLNPNLRQGSAQEQRGGNYLLGGFVNDIGRRPLPEFYLGPRK
jgi:ribonucleoside-diphosphate reductase beta chain